MITQCSYNDKSIICYIIVYFVPIHTYIRVDIKFSNIITKFIVISLLSFHLSTFVR